MSLNPLFPMLFPRMFTICRTFDLASNFASSAAPWGPSLLCWFDSTSLERLTSIIDSFYARALKSAEAPSWVMLFEARFKETRVLFSVPSARPRISAPLSPRLLFERSRCFTWSLKFVIIWRDRYKTHSDPNCIFLKIRFLLWQLLVTDSLKVSNTLGKELKLISSLSLQLASKRSTINCSLTVIDDWYSASFLEL